MLKGVLLVAITLVFFNCQKEEIVTEDVTPNNGIKLSVIGNSELQNNAMVVKKIEDFNAANPVLNAKGVKVTSHDFTINTGSITYIEKGDLHSYTFAVNRSNKTNKNIENLVLILNKSGGYDAMLVNYDFTKKQLEAFEKKDLDKRKVSYKPIELNYDKLLFQKAVDPVYVCVEAWSYQMVDGGDEGELVGHDNVEEPTYEWVLVSRDCDFSSSSSSSDALGINDMGQDNSTTSDNEAHSGFEGGGSSSTGTVDTTDNDSSSNTVIITSPTDPESDAIHGTDKTAGESLISRLNLSDTNMIDWAKDYSNLNDVNLMLTYLDSKNNTKDAKENVESSIDLFLMPAITNSNSIDYKAEVLRMVKHLREWGDPEHRLFADYIESLTKDFDKMTRGEVIDISRMTYNKVQSLTRKYFTSIIMPLADAAYPFITYAIFDATLAAAIPLLSRIPVSMVLRGYRLKKMVKKVGLLGVRSKNSHNIRIVTTTNPVRKAKELFATLTKNAISKSTSVDGVIVANMGKGNYITYRPLSSSSTGYEATIDLKFLKIWANVRKLKFKQ